MFDRLHGSSVVLRVLRPEDVAPWNPESFLKHVWPHAPDGQRILIFTLPDKSSWWFQSAKAAAECVAGIKDRNVYVGIGLAGRDYGPTRRCLSDEITGLCGFVVDLDMISEAHKGKPLPESIEPAVSILPFEMPPTFVILTGNGLQVWYFFKEPYIFSGPDDRTDIARLSRRFHKMLQLTASSHGWVYDPLSDLARVVRVPGTKNLKDSAQAKDVRVYAYNDRRYNPSDFRDLVDEAGIRDPNMEGGFVEKAPAGSPSKPLVINLRAEISDAKLWEWMKRDRRFPEIWERRRPDLRDQSQSGYDMALACLSTRAGLTDQEIVNLITHHRRMHRQKARTKLYYFQRTIANARSAFTKQQLLSVQPGTADQDLSDRSSFSTVHVSEEGAPTSSQQEQGNGDQAEEKTPTDPALAKAELCSRISDLLGVRILRIAKIPGKEPQYRMELENAKIEFACVGDLISQERVRTKIAGAVDYLPRKLPSKVWESLAQLMLSACTVESTTEETDWTGSTRMFLRQHLSDAIFIDSVDGQLEQNVCKPMVLDGQTSICASEFRNHINNMFRRLRLLLCAAAIGYRYDR